MKLELKGVLQRFNRMNSGRIYPADLFEKYAMRLLADLRMKRIRKIYEKGNRQDSQIGGKDIDYEGSSRSIQ
jgi:hypothetical protein